MGNGKKGHKYSTAKRGKFGKAGYHGSKTQYRSRSTKKRYEAKHKQGVAVSHSGGKAGTTLGGKWESTKGWQFGGHKSDSKGRNWNARESGGDDRSMDDRPDDTGANMRAAAANEGGVVPGVRDQVQRDYQDWYHSTQYTGRTDITRDTDINQWHKGLKRNL